MKKIPIDFIRFVVWNRCINQSRVFIYLKNNCDGYFPYKEREREICKQLGIHLKSLRSHIDWLEKHGWIIRNDSNDYIKVISFNRLCLMLWEDFDGVNPIACVANYFPIYRKYKSFVVGTFITYIIDSVKRGKSGHINKWDGVLTDSPCDYRSGTPVSNSLIAKAMRVSITTACEYKTLAKREMYISCHKNFELTEFPVSEYSYLRKNSVQDFSKRLRLRYVWNGKRWIPGIYIQLSDLLTSKIYISRSKKIKALIKWKKSETV